jgi:hypothetical protein
VPPGATFPPRGPICSAIATAVQTATCQRASPSVRRFHAGTPTRQVYPLRGVHAGLRHQVLDPVESFVW